MKKFKLFLAACAAMVSLGVQAGSDWVAPSAPSAADPVSGGVYKIRNVGAGQYLSGGSAWFSWATSAVLANVNSALEWTVTGSDAAGYTLACNQGGNNKLFTSGNGIAGEAMHVDGANAGTYFFEKQANGTYYIRQNGVTGLYVGGPDSKGGVLAQVNPADYGCEWEFVPTSSLVTYGPTITYAETRAKVLAYANATDIYTDQNDAKATLVNGVYAQDDVVDAATTAEEVNGAIAAIKALVLPFIKAVKINDGKSFDVSEFFLANPSFETGNLNGWTNSGMGAQGNTSFGKTGSYYAESWQPNGTKSLSQELQSLPAGYYTLSVKIKARGVTSAKVYAGTTEAAVTIGDVENIYSVTFSCEDNANVTIGFEGVGTGAGASWLALDNFTLNYLGTEPLVLFQNELADAVAAAKAHAATLSVPAAALTAYNNAIAAAEANNATVEACQNGVADIEAATATVDALASNYTRYQNIKSAALTIAASLDVTAADAEVAAATTNEAIDAAVVTLRDAFLAELPNVTVPETGLDVTAVMVDNASVSQNTNYWTAVGTPNTNYSWAVCNYGECEFYQQNFKFYQTLALNPGTWEFGVTGFHRAGNHSTYFYAGEDKILIPGVGSDVVNTMAAAKTYFDGGNGKVALKFLVEEAGNIEIGIDNQDTETDKWTIFRNFTLKYFGAPDYTVYDEQLAAAVAAAKAVEGNVPAAVYTTLDGVVTENNKTYTKKADYLAAIAAIESATTTAKTTESTYAAYKLDKAAAEALAAVANDNSEANGVFVAAISSAATDAEAATTVEAINAAAASLKTAMTTYVFAANPVGDGAKFDCTFLLTNPDVSSFPAWTPRADVPGWYTDMEDGNSQTMTNDAATSEDGTKTHFFEYWSNPAKANDAFALYQKVTLPAGTFDISCYAFAQDQYAGTNSVGVYFYANDTQGSAVTTTRLTQAGISFVNTAEQEVKIGLKTIAGNSYNWMGIGYVELYKVPAKVVTIDENADYVAENAAATVELKRTIKANVWNTIVLPFQLNADELKAAFGDDVQIAEFSDAGESEAAVTVNFNVMATPAITPNKPVLLKTSTAGTEYTFEGRTVAAGEAKFAGTYVDFVGTYAAKTTIAEGNYFISADKLYKSEGATTVKGTRAYIDAKNASAGVKLFIGGIETAISEINGDAAEQGAIFNLAGQRVNNAQKGIYIVGGKKVLVK